MLSKCFGIISWFPDDYRRDERKRRFNSLIKTLDEYFKLPIIIIAQNWRPEDLDIEYSNKIIIYQYDKLGITKARIKLREKLLENYYDYYILLEDDAVIECTHKGAQYYLDEIDLHPNMFGMLNLWLRMYAISNYILQRVNFDFIKDLDVSRCEIWDDAAFRSVWQQIYSDKFFCFTGRELKEVSLMSEQDKDFSTWFVGLDSSIQTDIERKTVEITEKWLEYERKNSFNNNTCL